MSDLGGGGGIETGRIVCGTHQRRRYDQGRVVVALQWISEPHTVLEDDVMAKRVWHGGMIGAGVWSVTQLTAWADVLNAKIIALADRHHDRRAPVAEQFGIPQQFDDVPSMLKHGGLDFVDVCTRPYSHAALTKLAADHVLPVLCQKPFCTSMNAGPRRCRALRAGRRAANGQRELPMASLVSKGEGSADRRPSGTPVPGGHAPAKPAQPAAVYALADLLQGHGEGAAVRGGHAPARCDARVVRRARHGLRANPSGQSRVQG